MPHGRKQTMHKWCLPTAPRLDCVVGLDPPSVPVNPRLCAVEGPFLSLIHHFIYNTHTQGLRPNSNVPPIQRCQARRFCLTTHFFARFRHSHILLRPFPSLGYERHDRPAGDEVAVLLPRHGDYLLIDSRNHDSDETSPSQVGATG